MAGVRGDFSALQHVRNGLRFMADGRFARELRTRLGAAAVSLVTEEFRTQRDPYGRQWKPSARAVGEGGMTLSDTGRLRASFSSQPTVGGFVIGTNVKYAAIHQYGGIIRAKNGKYLKFRVGRFRGKGKKRAAGTWVQVQQVTIPQRQIVPERDLGTGWRTAFADEATELLHETFD